MIAGAGHPPPVLALADGTTQVLPVPAGLPLGLSSGTFDAAQVSLPSGATLALYTDGLAESRTRPLEDGIAALRDALGSALRSFPVAGRRLRGCHPGAAPARGG